MVLISPILVCPLSFLLGFKEISLCIGLLGTGVVLAQDDFILSWSSVTSSGATTGGDYVLNGAVGQSEVAEPAIGGGYRLSGGVWGGDIPALERLYLLAIQK
jgi:hypothetical protein